jgi:hypothetical protein
VSVLFKLNEIAEGGNQFNLLIIMLGNDYVEATMNKNEHSCSEDFYFAATNVK